MTTQIIINNISTTNAGDHAIDIAAAGDELIVAAGVIAAATGSNANGINAAQNVAALEVLGDIVSSQGRGINLLDVSHVTLGETASVFAKSYAISVGADCMIDNHASLTSFSSSAILMNSSFGQFNTLVNSGYIASSSSNYAVLASDGDDDVFNTGHITSLYLGNGNNLYDGRGGGVVDGPIVFGNGNDIAYGGDHNDSFDDKGGGNDVFEGNGGDDTFVAYGVDDDVYDGGAGRDLLGLSTVSTSHVDLGAGVAWGADIGHDTLIDIEDVNGSNQASDIITGDALANRLHGFGFDDTLDGAGGNDFLYGDSGLDRLIGGTGRDFLSGGSGADIFDFNAIGESGISAATRDRIADFAHLVDKIDLSTIDAKTFAAGNQAFKFIGAGAFTTAGGQVRVTTVDGDTLVQVSNDHDVAPEMTILLHGLVTLSAVDFIL